MIQIRKFVFAVAPVTLAFALAGFAPAARADEASNKSVQNEAEFVKYDEAASTVTVKITKKGKGNTALMKQFEDQVKPNKETTFNVIPTGSVLKRTSVAINGVKGEIKDLKPGKTIQIYWVEDPAKKGQLFARKIDVTLSEDELDKRYETVQ